MVFTPFTPHSSFDVLRCNETFSPVAQHVWTGPDTWLGDEAEALGRELHAGLGHVLAREGPTEPGMTLRILIANLALGMMAKENVTREKINQIQYNYFEMIKKLPRTAILFSRRIFFICPLQNICRELD